VPISKSARDVGACHGEVGHHDDGTAIGVALSHAVEHRLQLLRTLAEHVGHGDDETTRQFDDVVVLPAVIEGHRGCHAHKVGVREGPHGAVGMEARGRVVVAGGDDDVHVGQGLL